MYLPAIPFLKTALSTDEIFVKTAISGFFIAFCFGQFLWGPISDNFKRHAIVFITLGIATIGTLLCAIATNIWLFIAGRLLQGVGIGAIPALSRSIINDVYAPNTVLKLMVYLTSLIAVATSLAPLMGAFFLNHWGWRSIFSFQLLVCVTLLFFSVLYQRRAFHFTLGEKTAFFSSYKAAIQNRVVLFHLITYSLVIGSLVAFYSASPFLLIKIFKLSSEDYGALLLAASIFYIMAVVVVRLLLDRLSENTLLLVGLGISFLGGLTLFLFAVFNFMQLWNVIIPLFIYLFGAAFIPPITNTKAMQAVPRLSGTISSLMGAVLALSSGLLSYILINLPIHHLIFFSLFFIVIPTCIIIYYSFHYR
ncbi:MAG: hypothetical protein A3F41_04760 [Coxiella sp. RIFCSPHIGHO2_12_FULL_44_14]|nr:MAG: hypothetical protein A3F41_04760 [Coxiella sp. RIFCSPHIGHO2_12_FULL_44_14]